MKNEIYFYYKLIPTKIYQQKNVITFYTNKKKYMLYRLNESKIITEEKCKLYNQLLTKGIYCHKIILNINGDIVTNIRNNFYVLMEISIDTRKIEPKDIIYFMSIKINNNDFKNIKRDNWKNLWGKKVDHMEQQHSYICKKNHIYLEEIDFFIGITETCISLMNELDIISEPYSLNHNRLSPKTTTDEFYNPFELILDIRLRDLAEYIKKINGIDKKTKILRNIITNDILNETEILLLFIRVLFPSEYLDLINTDAENKNEFNTIEKRKTIMNEYCKDTKKIYQYLKGIFNLPDIEWMDSI